MQKTHFSNSALCIGVSLIRLSIRDTLFSYEITPNAPLKPFAIASAEDSLEL